MISSVSEKKNGEANIFVCFMVFLRLYTGDNKVDGCGVCECGWKGGGEGGEITNFSLSVS